MASLSLRQSLFERALSQGAGIGGHMPSLSGARSLLGSEVLALAAKLPAASHPHLTAVAGRVHDRTRLRPRGILLLLAAHCVVRHTSPRVRSLSDIVEVIHAATLIHDGLTETTACDSKAVVDANKLAVLTGDLLLAYASSQLAALMHPVCVEEVSAGIAESMEARFMKLDAPMMLDSPDFLSALQRQSGLLLSRCCRAALQLTRDDASLNNPVDVTNEQRLEEDTALASFAANMGTAFELADDCSVYCNPLNDPNSSVINMPAILAAMQQPSIREQLKQASLEQSELVKLRTLVKEGNALHETNRLCVQYAEQAITCLAPLPGGPAVDALVQIAKSVSGRCVL